MAVFIPDTPTGGSSTVYPKATVTLYCYSCTVTYSSNLGDKKTLIASGGRSNSVTLKDVANLTIFGLQKIPDGVVDPEPSTEGGYVCVDNYKSARVISDDSTFITKQLGIVPYIYATGSKAVQIGTFSNNPHPVITIAVYPKSSMTFWTRSQYCNSFDIESLKDAFDTSSNKEFTIKQNSDYSYYPVFMDSSDAYLRVLDSINSSYVYASNFKLPSNKPYAQVVYSESILNPYPTAFSYGKTSKDKFNIPIQVLSLEGKEKCVPPVWVYVRGIDNPSQAYYSPENYTSPASQVSKGVYVPRTTAPELTNPYYLRKGKTYQGVTGLNPCIQGNPRWQKKYNLPEQSVLTNCVGYAVGRFNEIIGENNCNYLTPAPNACDFVKRFGTTDEPVAPKARISYTPQLGACIVWGAKSGNPCGHVAIVEDISEDGETITVSHSGWGENGDPGGIIKPSSQCTVRRSNNWAWYGHPFLAFLLNPAIKFSGLYDSGSNNADDINWDAPVPNKMDYSDWHYDNGTNKKSASDIQINVERELIGTVNDIHGLNLLSTPTLVESPFIEVKIGNYTFGSYTKAGTAERGYSEQRVTYPNYMQSLRITKVNGAVNQYVLTMQYQIQAGEDPNLIDKVFSSVSDNRKITLSYGDWNAPSFIYRNEDAIITKVTSNVEFGQSRITYTVYCTSTALSLKSKVYDFPARRSKPSDIIRGYIRNNSYGILDLFYGMKADVDKALSLIASDDKVVDINPQQHVDILTYINFLVANMISSSNKDTNIQNSMYALIMRDELTGELEGPYFKIVKVAANSKSLTSSNVYEVDVGYPGETLVLDFRINNDNSWAILYNYSDKLSQDEYVYKIDNEGRMYTEYSPNITTSDRYKETTSVNKTWWTQMTQFPITATLTIKGLIRPAMLMENVRINAYFYGQRHVSSGLYVITKQEDTVDRGGYKTTLSLLRIAGDEDELYNIKQIEVTRTENKSVDNGSFGGGRVGAGGSGGGKVGSGRVHSGAN